MDLGKTTADTAKATVDTAKAATPPPPTHTSPDDTHHPSDHEQARKRFRRSRKRRHTWISSLCTLLGLVALGTAAVASPGWERVDSLFLDGAEFRAALPDLLRGFCLNIQMFLIAEVLILVLGLLIALVRVTRAPGLQPLRLAATVYVDVFRGVPTLLLVFLVGFGLPALRLQGTPSQPWVLGVIALVLSYAAYVGEVLRAGLNSVHPAQRNAARALGLGERQTLRYVVLPQAVRNVLPPLLNDFIALQKDTALVAVLGPLEALRAAQIKADYDFNYTPYLGAALLFIAVTIPLTRFADRLQRRAAQRTWAETGR
ncbi:MULTISPECIES: amino acid ABC transporter permease [Streptomyces]|uniref:amino acid ABC transporter permease n=1 Tax=Streptomyces TaxID=1883 RepID=UPI00017EA331|nr:MULTISPECIES: amino acid ABC transporter permease [Streptomyces]EDX21438.1 polar amino acid ABC transporter [Streptomyces sp. Mg1]RPK32187.1 Arginine transport system permease protein ArtQ [Streptomyces sp. ADI91-18]WBY18235.1 amino acid ABC transporter permease [Streptomyces goshikiensis]WSS02860.1 amino acid ABC transporter permease [Streptomyces goshikiensis]